MNTAERRDQAILHDLLLPGGCPGCGKAAARLWWMDQGEYVDLYGFDALNHLLEPLGDAAWRNEYELDVWVCGGCRASAAIAWKPLDVEEP